MGMYDARCPHASMTALKVPNVLGRKGSMGDRRPLGRRRSSGFGRYSSSNHSSGSGDQQCRSGRACGMIVLAALIGGILCSPYILLGPKVVLSVSVRTAVSYDMHQVFEECFWVRCCVAEVFRSVSQNQKRLFRVLYIALLFTAV